MSYEVAIEIPDGPFPASSWQRAYGDVLTGAAVSNAATDWRWVSRTWGMILEVAFPDEADYLRFRASPAVRSALDAVPEGIDVHRGWGGTSGDPEPRRPRPPAPAGAAAVPLPA